MKDYVAELYTKKGKKLCGVTTHPGVIRSYIKNDKWYMTNFTKLSVSTDHKKRILHDRLKFSFYYKGDNDNFEEDIWSDI